MGKLISAPNVETAVRIYAEYSELGTEQIRELFGNNICDASILKLKQRAIEQMKKDGTATFGKYSVDTDSAYKAWNLDIKVLEARYKRLVRLRGET